MNPDKLDFYREARTCRKCGGSATTRFGGYLIDLIERKCLRCGYKWRERPLDHTEAQASKQENQE